MIVITLVESIYIQLPPREGAVFIVTLFHLTVLHLKIQMFLCPKKQKNISKTVILLFFILKFCFKHLTFSSKKEYNPKHKITGEETVTTKPQNRRENTTSMKKLVALTMATAMTLSLAACGGASSSSAAAFTTATTDTASSAAESTASEAEDTITVMVPPVTGDYLDKMTEWADEFHEMYPNLTMEVIGTSWDDHTTKLSTMAQAGEAPDISENFLLQAWQPTSKTAPP